MTTQPNQHPSLALMKRGVFVKLDISSFIDSRSYFNIDDVDFGVTPEEKKIISAQAEKFAMPKSELNKLMMQHMKANSNLNKFSFNTKWGNFIPITAFKQWKAIDDEIRDGFFNKVKDICMNYDGLVERIKGSCGETANAIWGRLFPNSGPPTDSFMMAVSDKILKAIPSKASLMCNVKYDAIVSFLNLDHLLKDYAELPAEEKETNDILKTYLLDGGHALDQFYNDTVLSNKESISTDCKYFLNDLDDWICDRRPTIKKRTHVKLELMVNSFKLFNFYNDKNTLAEMENLKEEIYKPIEIIDKKKIQSLLTKIISLQS